MWETKMISEAKARADAKYHAKTYTYIGTKVRKDSGLKEKYQDYADSLNIGMSELIVKALNYVINNKIKL